MSMMWPIEEETVYDDSGYLSAKKREGGIIRNHQGKRIRYKNSRRPPPEQARLHTLSGTDQAPWTGKIFYMGQGRACLCSYKKQLQYRKTRCWGLRKQIAKLNIVFTLTNLILADWHWLVTWISALFPNIVRSNRPADSNFQQGDFLLTFAVLPQLWTSPKSHFRGWQNGVFFL